jgi:hypothetical protein
MFSRADRAPTPAPTAKPITTGNAFTHLLQKLPELSDLPVLTLEKLEKGLVPTDIILNPYKILLTSISNL